MQSRGLIAGALFALTLSPAPALGNGRFPAADQILLNPADPAHLVLRATFGLLQSRDSGRSWTWICEAAVGYMGDPAIAVLGDGSLLAGFFGSVAVSADVGCNWGNLTLETRYQYAFDTTLDPANPARAWVLTVSVDGSRQVSLLSVDSSGAIVEALPVGGGFVPSTVEVAPSNPNRIYVTGAIENEPSIVLRSEDRGHNWQRFAFDAYGSSPLFISAVDPLDPNLVYARIDNQQDASRPTTQRQPSDHLLVSRDAGENWETVFSLDGDLYGFALSPDGSRIATGGPELGLYLASAQQLDFKPAPAPVRGLRCLRWTAEGLLACGQETLDGWTVGLSRDEGQSFEPLWHVTDLAPLVCSPTSSTGAVCPAVWPDVARTIGAERGEPPTIVGPPPPAAQDDGGCSFSGTLSRAAPSRAAPSRAAPSPPAPSPPALSRAALSRAALAPLAGWLPFAAALGWFGRRRRRQGTSI
ncbi:MAG: hypothetical protein ABI895_36675 [Deltaproteobacteria bacterium]